MRAMFILPFDEAFDFYRCFLCFTFSYMHLIEILEWFKC